MPAQKLPDINTAIIKHRNDAINAFVSKNYPLVKISLSSINALLPEEYKVEVNTEKYNKLIEEQNFVFCETCQEDIPRKTIQEFEQDYSLTEQFMLQEKKRWVWICPKCENQEDHKFSKFTVQKMQAPYYLKCIPSAPIRLGLRNRYTFDNEMANWTEIAFSEIESQISIFRSDYQTQQASDGLDEIEEKEEQ